MSAYLTRTLPPRLTTGTQAMRMTMQEVFEETAQKLKAEADAREAYYATPEGRAEQAKRAALDARMLAAAEPPDAYEDGRTAALSGDGRDPPDDLSEADAELWLDGWDRGHSEAED